MQDTDSSSDNISNNYNGNSNESNNNSEAPHQSVVRANNESSVKEAESQLQQTEPQQVNVGEDNNESRLKQTEPTTC